MKDILYPLKFMPILKEKIWGGHKLYERFNKGKSADQKIGESWEIADLDEGQSIVKDGPLEDKTLKELIAEAPEEFLGKKVHEQFGDRFPLLIKFIDAAKDLSIQVHPSDENSPTGVGKTEMWYIIQADEGAQITVGFKTQTDKEQFRKDIEQNKVEEVLDQHEVNHGDSFFINAGRIHAIGGGVLLAEIQQTSDVTYRVYDYNRKDDDGNLRELHVEESLEVLDFEPTQDFNLDYKRTSNKVQEVKHHTYFKTDWMHLDDSTHTINREDSFTVVIVVSGSLSYSYNDTSRKLAAGESMLIPAAVKNVALKAKDCEFLEVHL